MIGDEPQMKQLHDRATRGHTLTADEQAQLDAWYAAQDVDEAAMLSVATMPDDLRDLQSGVEHVTVLDQLKTQQAILLPEQGELLRLQRELLQLLLPDEDESASSS